MTPKEKPLNIGMIGYGFMGRAHSNGYRKVNNFFDLAYRRVPAVTLAKQLIDEGRLGRIFHYRAVFLQDWTISGEVPQGGAGTWRLDVDAAGSGVTGDLLAHCIDTARWLNGEVDTVTAMTE